MLRCCLSLGTVVLAGALAAGGQAPLVAVECEHASRLGGPVRLCRDSGASRIQCVEVAGKGAQVLLPVRFPRNGAYSAWVRVRRIGKDATVTLAVEGGKPQSMAVGAEKWHWVKLGQVEQRRGRRVVRLSADGALRADQLVLAADAAHTPKGLADTSGSLRYALPEVYFADNFMRTSREPGAWEIVTGSWKIRELRVREGRYSRPGFDPTRSANAFSYLGIGEAAKPGITLSGYPFWRNYSFEAAARSSGGQPFGLILLHQDAKNYYLLRVEPTAARIQLLRCLDGALTPLATREGGLHVDQWYRLCLSACDGQLIASIDGHEILRATDPALLDGRPGFWSADPAGVFFDDALVRSHRAFRDAFEDASLAGWEAVGGQWKVAKGGVAGQGALLNHREFKDFEASALLAACGGEAGVVFDWRDAKNHACLALVPKAGRAEIREVAAGKATVVASAKLPGKGGGPRTVRVTRRGGRVRAYLDGRPVVGAFLPKAAGHRAGLFAAGGAARFDRAALIEEAQAAPDHGHNRIFAGEDTMSAWASAGCDWQVATAAPRTIAWHKVEHWGDCGIRYKLPETSALAGKLGLVVRGDGAKLESGLQLVVEPKAKAPPSFTLSLAGKTLGTAKAPSASVKAIELRWSGRCAAALADGKIVLWHRAATPPPGRRVAIWTEGWPAGFACLGSTKVESANVIDDYFEAAPVAWRTESGEWEMQNRWTCSPQWSWMGGSSSDAAMLWTKRAFGGDITVHFFGAFQMKQRGARIYRTSDLDVTICGDGRNVSSGYTFRCGAANNTVSQLLRREKVVVETAKTSVHPPAMLDTTPSTNYLHRKWWHIAIEKRGNTVSCYMDDKLVGRYVDPKPLEGGKVCLWTHDNSIMIARATIAYESGDETETPLLAPKRPASPKLPPPPAITASHPAVAEDFEDGLGKWKGTPGSSQVGVEPRGQGLALAVTAPRSGARLQVDFPVTPFDAMALPRLAFDYRIPPAVKVNLHLTVNGQAHAIHLTDPAARPLKTPALGAAAIQADGKWHTADIDLRALCLRAHPTATVLPVTALSLGSIADGSYLGAGFGGNYAGVTFHLDNVRLWRPGPPEATFSWDPKLAVSHTLDRKPDTVPDDKPEKPGTVTHKGLGDGTWYFHLKAKTPKGGWTRVAHRPVVVDKSPPRLAGTTPPVGKKSAAHRLVVQFADESGIDPKSLASVGVQGKAVPVGLAPVPPQEPAEAASYDPASRRLTVDLTKLPLSLKDNQALELALPAVADPLGHKMAAKKLAWRFDLGADKQPPTGLRLTGSHPYLCRDDFETGLGQWAPTSTFAIIERDPTTAATGRYSLRIHNPHGGGAFGVVVRSAPFDAGRYPVVAFDYKAPPSLRADLVLTLNGTSYTVRFTDPRGTNCIGAIPGVQADGQWHHTEFNLHEMLANAAPKAPTYIISQLMFADTGFAGNAERVEYHIDNFTIAPATSTRKAPLEWQLAASDPSGISAWQYSLAPSPAPVQWKDSHSPSWQFRNLGAGLFHFLVRARDGAGNWSAPLRRKILIDDEPPAIKALSPKPGQRYAKNRIRITLTDGPSGINRDKTTLTVAGTAYRTAQEGLVYNSRTQTLTWAGHLLDKPVTFANGQAVPCQLVAEDNVGNTTTHKWSWTMDYSLDKTPPPTPYVARVPSKSFVRNTFETGIGGTWKDYGKYGSIARSAATAATGRYSLRIRATRSQSYFGAYARRGTYNAAGYPIISFDYCFPPGLPMNLHVHTGTAWQTIRLSSPTAYYTVLGTVPLKADGKWHHAEINLLKYLKPTATSSGRSALYIRYVLFADFASRSVTAGRSFHIDNFAISAPETGQNLAFEWTTVGDATGIAGYAYAMDKQPAALPSKLQGAACAAAFKGLAPGTWHFHLRARDGAGNWSAPIHIPTTVTAAASLPKPAPVPKTKSRRPRRPKAAPKP